MELINLLPQLLTALRRWEKVPHLQEFVEYMDPMEPVLGPMLNDFSERWRSGFYDTVTGLSWADYRAETLRLDPEREERRARKHLRDVEELLGVKLKGEMVLFGAFTAMDGYARFDQGTHRVYLGVDESHGRGAYLDVLISHELTHVAREPLPEVWAGFGLNPCMSHDEFTVNQPVIEHLMGEGFSCLVSEMLNPREEPWGYVYQTEDTLARVYQHGPAVDRIIHSMLRDPSASYRDLYGIPSMVPGMASYAHYVWAWEWSKHLLRTHFKGDPRLQLRACSKDLISDALRFRLPSGNRN